MRVLINGYYGKLNGGDDLLQNALSDMLAQHRLTFSSWLPGFTGINHADLLVLGGGSIWPGQQCFAEADRLRRHVHIPIAVVGVSARSEDDAVLAATRRLAPRTVFFHVRDRATADYFGLPERINVGPDLFWWGRFLPIPEKPCSDSLDARRMRIAVNLREWRHQDWSVGDVASTLRSGDRDILGWPLHFGWPEGRGARFNDQTLLSYLGFSVGNVLSWKTIMAADYAVAMRYHAVQVAIRLAKPVIGFDYHAKTRAFFAENDLSELCVPLTDLSALRFAMERIESDYPGWCNRFHALANRLRQQGQDCRAEFLKTVDAVDRRGRIKTFRSRAAGLWARVGETLF